MIMTPFTRRKTAGGKLANLVSERMTIENPVIVCIAKHGIPVATEVASKFKWPLEMLAVRTLHMPSSKKESLGAVTSQGDYYVNIDTNIFGTNYKTLVERLCRFEKRRLKSLEQSFKNGHKSVSLKDKDVVIADDGAFSGASILAAIKSIKKQQPKSVSVILPYITPNAISAIQLKVDHLFYLAVTSNDSKPSELYQDEKELSDLDLKNILQQLWSGKHKPILTLSKNITNTNMSRAEPEIIEKYYWPTFSKLFNSQHAGWNINAKTIGIANVNKKLNEKPFSKEAHIKHAEFIEINYVQQLNIIFVRYILSGTLLTWRIFSPKRLVYRDYGENQKSLRIDTSNDETYFISVKNEASDTKTNNESEPSTSKSSPHNIQVVT